MTTDDDTNPTQRRLNIRRSRGNGFGRGTSTRSESLRVDDDYTDEDEVDHAVDPDAMRDRILRNAQQRPYPQLPAPAAPNVAPSHDGVPPDPRSRMDEVAQAGNAEYSREYRLTLLHRLLMRKVPLDQIANQLGVSVSTVQKDRIKLKERLRELARQMDINEIVGNQMELYGEISGMALRTATDNNIPTPMRLAAMRTTLAAEADRTRFLNTAGVFDVLRFRRAEDGSDVSDVQMLMSQTSDMLERIMASDDPEPAPAPRPKRVARAARPGGFGKMTMDDRDASNSSSENVEL